MSGTQCSNDMPCLLNVFTITESKVRLFGMVGDWRTARVAGWYIGIVSPRRGASRL